MALTGYEAERQKIQAKIAGIEGDTTDNNLPEEPIGTFYVGSSCYPEVWV